MGRGGSGSDLGPVLGPRHQVTRRGARLQRFPHRKPPSSGAAAVSPPDPHTQRETKGLNLGQET